MEKIVGSNVEKIDPALVLQLKHLEENGRLDEDVVVIIRTRATINEVQRAALEMTGLRINSVIEHILTGSVAAKGITKIGDLEFVIYIDISKKQLLR